MKRSWQQRPDPSLGADRGRKAEQLALDWLCRRGLKLLERNYRCRAGELDLVMQDGEWLVFVEVRYRSGKQFGGAAASVNQIKQQRLYAAASHYLLQRHGDWPPPCRFDVLCMEPARPGRLGIRWLRNAFVQERSA